MDLITTNLREARKVLSKIEVRRAVGNFLWEDWDESMIPATDAYKLTPEQTQLDPLEEELGYMKLMTIEFYGGDGTSLGLEALFQRVREELNENFSMPLEKSLKYSYLTDILKLYSDLEIQIVEDEIWKFKYDNLVLVDLEIETLDKKDKEIFFANIISFKKTLRDEIRYLNNLQNKLLEHTSNTNQRKPALTISTPIQEIKKKEPKIFKKKSFEINPKLYNSDPKKADAAIAKKLKVFKETLLKCGYIKPIDLRDFIRIFKNQDVKNPIQWDGNPKELYYLIKTLHDKEIIIKFKNYWYITCKCFIAYRKNNIVCTSKYLERCKAPTRGYELLKLNSAIDTLK